MENLEDLLTEQRNPASAGIDKLPTAEMLRVINEEDRSVAESVAAEIPKISRAASAQKASGSCCQPA